jgi:hypothetical protein
MMMELHDPALPAKLEEIGLGLHKVGFLQGWIEVQEKSMWWTSGAQSHNPLFGEAIVFDYDGEGCATNFMHTVLNLHWTRDENHRRRNFDIMRRRIDKVLKRRLRKEKTWLTNIFLCAMML